jgi:hypothetical protein
MSAATASDKISGMPGGDTTRPSTRGVKLTYDDFVLAPFDVVFSNLDVVEPDLLYLGSFVRVATLTLETEEVLTSPLLPGFGVALAEVFDHT